ncbi:MAG: hypothetical protein ACD_5C00220G0006 [uncultured bacterium]|nr:MAG: hypothetical protein ACD_5C00220G0006 [uncultured bacterium]
MRIFLRVDCNVPLSGRKVKEESAWRLEQTLQDIREYQKRGAIVVLAGHLGRPDGQTKLTLSLKPVARWYEKKLGCELSFEKNILSDKAVSRIKDLRAGSIIMLENLRFYKEEENDNYGFAKKLSRLADIYVNNAFGVCHREHASIHAITKYLPSYAGSVVIEEVENLSRPRAFPFVLVLGGIKLNTKMPILLKLGKEADEILVGGGVALAISSVEQGEVLQISGVDISRNERMLARQVMKKFADKLVSPIDYIAIRDAKVQTILASNLKRSDQLIDIGLSTQRLFKASVKNAKSIVYNGCLGSLVTGAESGTQSIAQALPIKNKIQSIVGGGDTVGFLQSKNLLSHFSFVSTGGGAMLAYLAGKKLPGLEVLEKK